MSPPNSCSSERADCVLVSLGAVGVASLSVSVRHHEASSVHFGLFALVGRLRLEPNGQTDFYFLPCAPKASVSFEGETQAGRGVHRLEVRRLAYVPPTTKRGQPMMASCVVYSAGDEYGPYILSVLDDCIDPLVRRVSKNVVEIYFLAGAHTHFRQRWTLLGSTARLEKQDEISWSDDPRMMADAEDPANRR